MNKCKVTILMDNGSQFQEQLSCEPYEAIELLCKLKQKVYDRNKITKTISGYEYCTRDKNIIIAV